MVPRTVCHSRPKAPVTRRNNSGCPGDILCDYPFRQLTPVCAREIASLVPGPVEYFARAQRQPNERQFDRTFLPSGDAETLILGLLNCLPLHCCLRWAPGLLSV